VILHWLVHFIGVDYGAPYGHVIIYNFWSGIGSDLSEITLAGLIYGAWRKHSCHTKGCWRIGRHQVDGTPWCNKHHGAARAKGRDHA
jgi:hypothetical protein